MPQAISSLDAQTDFKDGVPDCTPEQRRRILERDFDLRRSRSLVFTIGGGIGDNIAVFEVVARLREFLAKSSRKPFELIGTFHPARRTFYPRFLSYVRLFDRVSFTPGDPEAPTRFEPLPLSAVPWGLRVENTSMGSLWDFFWAQWGLPGPYLAARKMPGLDQLKKRLPAELAQIPKEKRPSRSSGYILLSPDSVTGAKHKSWPTENWIALARGIEANTRLQPVFFTSGAELREQIGAGLGAKSKALFYDYLPDAQAGAADGQGAEMVARLMSACENDLLRLSALVGGAKALVTVDSGPAFVAGMLKTPCLALFGPTTPIFYGHPDNTNLRVSSCPPCGVGPRSRVCPRNECMHELDAGSVANVLFSLLKRRPS